MKSAKTGDGIYIKADATAVGLPHDILWNRLGKDKVAPQKVAAGDGAERHRTT